VKVGGLHCGGIAVRDVSFAESVTNSVRRTEPKWIESPNVGEFRIAISSGAENISLLTVNGVNFGFFIHICKCDIVVYNIGRLAGRYVDP